MKAASGALIALLESGQFIVYDRFTFTLQDGTQIVLTTEDKDAIAPMVDPSTFLDTFSGVAGTMLNDHVSNSGATYANAPSSWVLAPPNGLFIGSAGVASISQDLSSLIGPCVITVNFRELGVSDSNVYLWSEQNSSSQSLYVGCYRDDVGLYAYGGAFPPSGPGGNEFSQSGLSGPDIKVSVVLASNRMDFSVYINDALIGSDTLPIPLDPILTLGLYVDYANGVGSLNPTHLYCGPTPE